MVKKLDYLSFDKLIVYGTLAPGRPNEHILNPLNGVWQEASVRGLLHQKGWGAAMGYPGIQLDPNGSMVKGHLLLAAQLSYFWPTLDEFEGPAYQRVLTAVTLNNQEVVDAYIYALK